MKKLNLTPLFIAFFAVLTSSAQVKIFPGGKVAIGTTNYPGAFKTLSWGPVCFKQSNYDQTIIHVEGLDQADYSNMMVSKSKRALVKNYVVDWDGTHTFCVYSYGDVWSRGNILSSDSTLKTQINTIDSALIKLLQLRGVRFKYKTDITDTTRFGGPNAKTYLGVIAQEVNAVLPEATAVNENGIMGVQYGNLSGLFIEGIKDLNTKVDNNNHWKLDSLRNIYRDTLNVGIGTAYPTTKLSVAGSFANTNGGFGIANTDSVPAFNNLKGVGIYSAGGSQTVGTCVLNVFTDTLAVMFHKNNNGTNVFGVEASRNGAILSYKASEAGEYTNFVWVDSTHTRIKGRDTTNSVNTAFYAGNYNELVRIQNNGFVGIGTMYPQGRLSVVNNSNGAAPTVGGYFAATGGYNNYAVQAYAPIDSANNYAGYFQGDVVTTGTYYTVSDEKVKTNIRAYNVNVLDKLKTLNVNTYVFDGAMAAKHNLPHGSQIGVMAQDVEKQWPGLVRTGQHIVYPGKKDTATTPAFDEFKVVNYTGLIPVLVRGMQQLTDSVAMLKNTPAAALADSVLTTLKTVQVENALLKDKLAALEDRLTKFDADLQYCCFNHNGKENGSSNEGSKLEQNAPNPFTENTTIRYYIAPNVTNAVIRIISPEGNVVNTFKIEAKGAGQILLSAGSLKAGTYVYELVVDGKQLDAKRMVLTY